MCAGGGMGGAVQLGRQVDIGILKEKKIILWPFFVILIHGPSHVHANPSSPTHTWTILSFVIMINALLMMTINFHSIAL